MDLSQLCLSGATRDAFNNSGDIGRSLTLHLTPPRPLRSPQVGGIASTPGTRGAGTGKGRGCSLALRVSRCAISDLRFIPPALAVAKLALPQGHAWLNEPKLDGWITLLTRGGFDCTRRVPWTSAQALQTLPASSALLDGEHGASRMENAVGCSHKDATEKPDRNLTAFRLPAIEVFGASGAEDNSSVTRDTGDYRGRDRRPE
jgi:hypothetical protein